MERNPLDPAPGAPAPEQERQARFDLIDQKIREEIRRHPDDLGTLSDAATRGGGGETLGESVTTDDEESEPDRAA